MNVLKNASAWVSVKLERGVRKLRTDHFRVIRLFLVEGHAIIKINCEFQQAQHLRRV